MDVVDRLSEGERAALARSIRRKQVSTARHLRDG